MPRYAQSIYGVDGRGFVAGSGGSGSAGNGFASSAEQIPGSTYIPLGGIKEDYLDYVVENGTADGFYPSPDAAGTDSHYAYLYDLPTDFTNSAESTARTNMFDSIVEYLEGFFTNQGKENSLNRDYNSAQAALNRDFQSQEAKAQRDWYEQMSNTAYQRSVADLKAAGLNPALAFGNGGAASAGTGVPAGSAASYNQSGGDTISSLLTSVANVISAVSGASASKYGNALKLIKLFM